MEYVNRIIAADIGRKVSCMIQGREVMGEIAYKNGIFYILQDFKDGMKISPHLRKGYKYSWCIADGSPSSLRSNDVTKLIFRDDHSGYHKMPIPIGMDSHSRGYYINKWRDIDMDRAHIDKDIPEKNEPQSIQLMSNYEPLIINQNE